VKLYLAGPMTGRRDLNKETFTEAARDLRARGLTVWNPCEQDLRDRNRAGEEVVEWSAKRGLGYFMRKDLPQVCASDAVVVLPGWAKSKGARREVRVARWCEIPVLRYPDLEPIDAEVSAEDRIAA